jgi:hypothetical protein
MKGAGYYDRHSGAQLSTIRALEGWTREAVAELRLPGPPRPVNVMDLGSSEGSNAIHVMSTIVKGLRKRTNQPIQTIFSDLASNNFNQLFFNLEKAWRNGNSAPGIFPGAVAGSFYEPLLPPGSVHFATSFNSLQWLDQLPAVSLPDSVCYRRPRSSGRGINPTPEATAAFTRQAEADLVKFLECRARELVPGGKLLLSAPGDSDSARVGDGLIDVLNDAWLDLVAAGRLKRDEYERITIPVYMRTVKELIAPLKEAGSTLRDVFSVDRTQALDAPTPFAIEFERSGDVAAYARSYTAFLRAFTEPVFLAALNQAKGGDRTVRDLYDRVRIRLQAEPERYWFRYILVAAMLTRR